VGAFINEKKAFTKEGEGEEWSRENNKGAAGKKGLNGK